MANSIEIFTIIGIVAVGAIFLPILLDENPGAFLENSLCIILAGDGGNTTCNAVGGNVTFVGLNGINITGNFSQNIIYWNFTGESINGSALMKFHSLGGDADVFKNQTIFDSYWRGITGGNLINVTERTDDILIDLGGNPNPNDLIFYNQTSEDWETFGCSNDGELIVYNATLGYYQCITGTDFSSSFGIDPDEIMYPWVAGTSTGTHVVLSFTNYDIRALRETGVGVLTTSLTWLWPVPANFDSNSNINFTLYHITQSASAGNFCHNLSIMPRSEGQNIDSTFGTPIEMCMENPGANILSKMEWELTPSQHNLDPNEMTFIKITRDPADTDDTFAENTYILVGRLEWNV